MDYWGEIDLLSVLQQRGLVPTIAGSVVSVVLYVISEELGGVRLPSSEIADEVMRRGIVAHISPRLAARLLKKAGCYNRLSLLTHPCILSILKWSYSDQ